MNPHDAILWTPAFCPGCGKKAHRMGYGLVEAKCRSCKTVFTSEKPTKIAPVQYRITKLAFCPKST